MCSMYLVRTRIQFFFSFPPTILHCNFALTSFSLARIVYFASQKSATRRGVEDVAWQLRSRLRDEYFGPLSHLPGARERAKYMSAVTARHTTRHPMVLSKPLSPVTGSVMTNVPLGVKAVDENIPRPDSKGKNGVASTSRSVRAKRVEDGGGSSMHRGELW